VRRSADDRGYRHDTLTARSRLGDAYVVAVDAVQLPD
jgi:hypothetical protein